MQSEEDKPKKPTREEIVTEKHLQVCLRLAELEAEEKCKKTPQDMKIAEIIACGQRIEYMLRGVTYGCCRYRTACVLCTCCNPEGIMYIGRKQ
jgi:hypothetical protein